MEFKNVFVNESNRLTKSIFISSSVQMEDQTHVISSALMAVKCVGVFKHIFRFHSSVHEYIQISTKINVFIILKK